MEYLKRLEDLDYAKIKDRRYDDLLNITIYVMEDKSVIFIQHRVNSVGFKFIDGNGVSKKVRYFKSDNEIIDRV